MYQPGAFTSELVSLLPGDMYIPSDIGAGEQQTRSATIDFPISAEGEVTLAAELLATLGGETAEYFYSLVF
jgi:hypothetical protein